MKSYNLTNIFQERLLGLGFLNRDLNITPANFLFKKYAVKCEYPKENNTAFDLEHEFDTMIATELVTGIMKQLCLELYSSKLDFLDLRNYKGLSKTRHLSDSLYPLKFEYMITNARFATEMQDSPLFHTTVNSFSNINSSITNIGVFNQANVYIDSMCTYNSPHIVFFNQIDFNTTDVITTQMDDNLYACEVKFSFRINFHKVICVLDEVSNNALSEFRNNKLNSILDAGSL